MSTSRLAEADIVIIGAGVMGASIAFQLSRLSEKKVIIVDQSPPLGGMSGRTFGQIRLHYSNALLLEMAKRGYAFFQNWDREVGYGDPGYKRLGYLLLVVESQLAALQRNVKLAQGLDIDTRFVAPDEIKAIEPALNCDGLVGGAFDPAGGYIDVTRIVLSFLTAALERGTRLMSGIRVQGIELNGQRTVGVATDQGLLSAPVVINVTGVWAGQLFSSMGIEVPIEARRLDTMYLRQPPGGAQIGCCITDGNSNVVVRPDMGRELLAAAYPPEMPLADDPAERSNKTSDAAHMARIQAAFAERLPDLSDAQPVRSVGGSYDITPDWHPILGWVPGIEGLYLAAGFSGHGLKLAPAVGEIVAATVVDRKAVLDVAPLRFERFEDNELMHLAYGPGGRA